MVLRLIDSPLHYHSSTSKKMITVRPSTQGSLRRELASPRPIHSSKQGRVAGSMGPIDPQILTSSLLIKSMSHMTTPRLTTPNHPYHLLERKPEMPLSASSSRPQLLPAANNTARVASSSINLIDYVETPRVESPRIPKRNRARSSPGKEVPGGKRQQVFRGVSWRHFKFGDMKTMTQDSSEAYLSVFSTSALRHSNTLRVQTHEKQRVKRGFTGRPQAPLSTAIHSRGANSSAAFRPLMSILATGKGYPLKLKTTEGRNK